MVKHIIMLTLCFMVYNIGNIDALTADERKAEFELVVNCYRQMYEYGLVKGVAEKHKTVTKSDSFQQLLTKFYENKKISTAPKGPYFAPKVRNKFNYKNNNIERVPTVNNKQFESDESFDSFKSEFFEDFVQQPKDFQNQINELNQKIYYNRGEIDKYPLQKFILEYKPTSNREYLRTTSAFCTQYSICPDFDDALSAEYRKAQFELAVKCISQMYEYGLVKGLYTTVEKSDSFQQQLKKFYTLYTIETVNDNNNVLPTVDNEEFKSDISLNYFKNKFFNNFVPRPKDFQNQINELKKKCNSDEINEYPLKKFILGYSPTSNEEYLTTTSAFCEQYSIFPTFEDKK